MRTRDGQEIDFLIETDGQIFPIEVKMGSISPNSLSRLDKIANSNWQKEQVVSLVAEDTPVNLTNEWLLCAPNNLDLSLLKDESLTC